MSENMNSRSNLFGLLMVVLAALALTLGTVGCGDDDGGGGNNGGGNNGGSTTNNSSGTNNSSTTNNTSTEEAYCCLNGQFYDCPTGDAAQACFDNFDPGTCTADSSRNSECSSGTTNNDTTTNNNTDQPDNSGGATGDQCEFNDECASNSCLVDGGATFGYCTTTCDDFTDCPTFWDCEEVGNASSKYCTQG